MLIQRATAFMRRELRIWSIVDTEFLTTYILSLLKAIDIRSDPAIRLLAEYLDDERYPRAAEHFAHELYSFLRSPFKDLRKYDDIAQVSVVTSARPSCLCSILLATDQTRCHTGRPLIPVRLYSFASEQIT